MKSILLISFFQLVFLSSLTEFQVIGGNYGNSYKFIISGTAREEINKSINIPITIIFGEEQEKEAKCSIENTSSGQTALYSCIYTNNVEERVYIKSGQNNFLESDSNVEIIPLSLEIKFLEAINLEFIDEIWQYELKGEKSETNGINLGSVAYMNIKVNETNKKAGCVYSSKEENILIFNCKINGLNQKLSDKILISENTEGNTLTFNSESNQDKNIIIYKFISFIEAKKLIFNENKWHFLIIVPYQSIPIATKSIVDILYNGALSSATCFSDDNSILDCQVDKEEQDESDLVKIHYIKSDKSTLQWSDLTKIYEIPIDKELKYINSYSLVYTSTKLWSFKIKYLETILPENALVTIDIKINDESSLAKCYHQNDYELNCKTQVIEEETLSLKISYEKKRWFNFLGKY